MIKPPTILVSLILSGLLTCSIAGLARPGASDSMAQNKLIQDSSTIWSDNIEMNIRETSKGFYQVNFKQKNRVLLAFDNSIKDLGVYPHSSFTLQDGNLASVWLSGGPYYIMNVFTFANGKVTRVLRTSSRIPIELAYIARHNHAVPQEKALPYQSIVVSQSEWQGGKLRPATADIYTWNELHKKYDSRKQVPWEKRFIAP